MELTTILIVGPSIVQRAGRISSVPAHFGGYARAVGNLLTIDRVIPSVKRVLPVVLILVVSGCFGGHSAATRAGTSAVGRTNHGPRAGEIRGRVLTRACGGPKRAGGCAPTIYRGSLMFCRTMSGHGRCRAAKVDSSGRYAIKLRPAGRWALIPAPATGNVVSMEPRWVLVVVGQTRTFNINGGNMEKAPI